MNLLADKFIIIVYFLLFFILLFKGFEGFDLAHDWLGPLFDQLRLCWVLFSQLKHFIYFLINRVFSSLWRCSRDHRFIPWLSCVQKVWNLHPRIILYWCRWSLTWCRLHQIDQGLNFRYHYVEFVCCKGVLTFVRAVWSVLFLRSPVDDCLKIFL